MAIVKGGMGNGGMGAGETGISRQRKKEREADGVETEGALGKVYHEIWDARKDKTGNGSVTAEVRLFVHGRAGVDLTENEWAVCVLTNVGRPWLKARG